MLRIFAVYLVLRLSIYALDGYTGLSSSISPEFAFFYFVHNTLLVFLALWAGYRTGCLEKTARDKSKQD